MLLLSLMMVFEFHEGFGCPALRSYADVSAALRDPQRFVISQNAGFDEASHTRSLRQAAEATLTPARLAAWRDALERIPVSKGTELMQAFAEPWSHTAALRLLGIENIPDDLARAVFNGDAQASGRLASLLPMTLGALSVQAFIATSQTLAAFLGNAIAALLEQQLEYPHTPLALEELFRFAGPSQAQFRYDNGTRVALLLAEANRDPEQFPEHPNQLDFNRRNATQHLAFGAGSHACLGANLMRLAAPIALRKFEAHYGRPKLQAIAWPDHTTPLRRPQSVEILY